MTVRMVEAHHHQRSKGQGVSPLETTSNESTAQGAHPKYIQAQLGHASIQTTLDRYGHLMPDTHAVEARKLDQLVIRRLPIADQLRS